MRSCVHRRRTLRRGALKSGLPAGEHKAPALHSRSHGTGRLTRGLLLGVCFLGLPALARAAATTPVMDPASGHYYQAVAVNSGITWNKANDAVQALAPFQGMHGHLATVTSPEENDFIIKTFPQAVDGYYCLGGIQSHGLLDPAAGWQWVTGEPWSYTNWNRLNGTEPNDAYGLGTSSQDENKLQFYAGAEGRWNDIRPTSVESGGYIVEYEPDPPADLPTITSYSVDQPGITTPNSVPPGTLLRVTGSNFGNEGTVLFDGDPLPAAIASWTPAQIRLWVPTAPSYPFQTHITVISNRQQGSGGDFTITAPTPGTDNLLANGSFEFPDSSTSVYDYGYTYGIPLYPDYPGYNGYSIPGWRIPFGTIDVYRDGWQQAPGQGRQSIDLVGSPGPGIIEQTFFTQPGKSYTFSGYMAHNPGIADARALIYLSHGFWTEDAMWVLYSWGYTSPASMGWQRFSFKFNAPAAQTTLMIQDISGLNDVQGIALDGLKVTPSN